MKWAVCQVLPSSPAHTTWLLASHVFLQNFQYHVRASAHGSHIMLSRGCQALLKSMTHILVLFSENHSWPLFLRNAYCHWVFTFVGIETFIGGLYCPLLMSVIVCVRVIVCLCVLREDHNLHSNSKVRTFLAVPHNLIGRFVDKDMALRLELGLG